MFVAKQGWGGRVVQWCWAKIPVPGRLTIWITVAQGLSALAVGAGGGCLDIFTLTFPFFRLSHSLWETARYGLKYCLKGPLNPNPTNQPTKSQAGLQISSDRLSPFKHCSETCTITWIIGLKYCKLRTK